MINSNSTSPTASPSLPKWLVVIFGLAALIGFSDTAYLTAEHLRGVLPPCSVVRGCETVLTSAYSVIAGVPLSAIGMAYYVTLLVLVVAFFESGNIRWLRWASWFTLAGFATSLGLVYLQAFVIHAFCQYCMLSALISVILVSIGIKILRTK